MSQAYATLQGTTRYSDRFPGAKAAGFYRAVEGLLVSNIGIGTYLGDADDATDRGYVEALTAAVRSGVNLIDTSLNYRGQRSERAVGAALRALAELGEFQRDEIAICTKAGYLTPGAFPRGIEGADAVGGMHSMAPAFLVDQLGRSLKNMGVATVDVFYLHNPETQLAYVSSDEFYARIRRAFVALEESVSKNAIRVYGAATWNGFRCDPRSQDALSLDRMAAIAHQIAGSEHHFRFIQLPFNLAMREAFADRVNGENLLSAARRLGISVVASASLLQSRLTRDLPPEYRENFHGAETDAQWAIQFVRSTPGIAAALAGMSRIAHVEENLALATVPAAAEEQYLRLFR